MLSPEEQLDLNKMKAKCDEIRSVAFNAMRDVLRYDATELKHSGVKTNEEALVSAFKYYQRQCDQLVAAHIKKWPD